MVASKGKKRALSYDSEEIEVQEPTTRSGKGGGSGRSRHSVIINGGDDWSAWQEGVRTQEADRVQQYVKTFQCDIVQKTHDSALASLRRRENTHAQREKKLHERILEECKLEGAGAEQPQSQSPLYVAGCQVLELLESTLDQYRRTEAALQAMASECSDGNKHGMKHGNKHGTESAKENSFEALRSSWDNDLVEARKLLSYGRAYGDGLVRDIIVPASPGSAPKTQVPSPTLSKDGSGINQTGKAALGMFPRSSTAVASRDTWGEAAHSQMEVLSRLMSTMSGGGHGGGHGGSALALEKKTVRFDI